jgi:hypothetical protein
MKLFWTALLATGLLGGCAMTVETNILGRDSVNGFRIEERAKRDVLTEDMFGADDVHELWAVNSGSRAMCVTSNSGSWRIEPGRSSLLLRTGRGGGNPAMTSRAC